MKKFLSLLLSAVMTISSMTLFSLNLMAAEQIPAFPGAEGGGKFATGGRGQKVVYVTNLNDSGAGSFREAVGSSNRIVLFKVGGTIELKSDVVVKSNITIAGQTAPGGAGITLKNYKIGLGGENVIMRYISSRPGDAAKKENDAFGGGNGANSIIDHCSFGWANDEQFGLYSYLDNFTTQWCVIGPSNCWSYHSEKSAHGFGAMFGRKNHSMHHNMLAHNISRNFRGKAPEKNENEFVNNVLYNWGYQTTYGTLAHMNYSNNYFKRGQASSQTKYIAIGNSSSNPENIRLYLTGNKGVGIDGTVYNDENSNWSNVNYSGSLTESGVKVDTPFQLNVNGVPTAVALNPDTADEAYEKVLKYAGAGINSESRPAIDRQVMQEAETGTGSLTCARDISEASSSVQQTIANYGIQKVTYEWPDAVLEELYTDSDGDGMPDDWELERGLDPYSKYDANGNLESSQDYIGDGYTNIEYFINDLTVDSFPEGVVQVSPKLLNSVVVNPAVAEAEGESYHTISAALDYMSTHMPENDRIRSVIEIAPGNYDEDVTVNLSRITLKKADADTLAALEDTDVIIKSIKVEKAADDFAAQEITFNNGGASPAEVWADKAAFDGCSFISDSTALTLHDNRMYFNNCTLEGADIINGGSAKAIFKECEIKSSQTGSIITASNGSFAVIDSILTSDAASGVCLGNGADSITYWNTKMGENIAHGEQRFIKTNENAVYIECGTMDLNGTLIDLTNIAAPSEKVVTELELLQDYSLYDQFAGDDSWNPADLSDVKPQEALKKAADEMIVPTGVITENYLLPSDIGDENVVVSWNCEDASVFDNNTIKIGQYGTGVKSAALTLTLSREGLTDETRSYNILVGSETMDKSVIKTFDEIAVGSSPEYFKISNADYDKDGAYANDAITWGAADNIDGTQYGDGNKFFGVHQTAATELDATVHSGQGIHDFTYTFGDMPNKIIEVGFDFFTNEIAADSYYEAYVKTSRENGSKSMTQMRIKNDGDYNINAYASKDSGGTEMTSSSVKGSWFTAKITIDSRSVESGRTPVINYYLYNSAGEQISALKSAVPYTAYDSANPQYSIPAQLVFRPNRKLGACEFYVDNIYVRDLTSQVEEEAKSVEVQKLYSAESGGSLPVYGKYMSGIEWTVTEGSNTLVDADGTINYDKCKDTNIKIRGTLASTTGISSNTDEFDIRILGTADTNPDYKDDRFFADADDFSAWKIQKDQASLVSLNDTTAVSGNSTSKIKLENKAAFKSFETPLVSGKARFETDFLTTAANRSFRIYFENAATAASGNMGVEDFSTANVFYHLMDVSSIPRVVTEDSYTANTGGTELSPALELNKWYRITVDVDMDAGTAETAIYLHGTDGSYAPDNIAQEPMGSVITSFVSKLPLELKQIRLVRTAGGPVYFDNLSLSKIESNEIIYGDADGDGVLMPNDAAVILQYVLDKKAVTADDAFIKRALVTGSDVITATDSLLVLQKVLDSTVKFPVEKM